MPTILITYQIPRVGVQLLEKNHTLIWPAELRMSKEELATHLPHVDGILAASFRIDQSVLDQAPNLKIIANYGTGYDHIDTTAAAARNIPVTNTPTAVTEATAELAFGLLLSLSRRIAEHDRYLREDPNFRWGMMIRTGKSVKDKTLGIIGFGKIGKTVARMALAFGMKIVYYNRTRLQAAEEQTLQANYLPLDDLLQQSDYISIHTPLTPETHHLLSEEKLALLQPHAFLVNTARGAVIDEFALLKALENGKLAGAALDVFEKEPKITEGLKKLDNVVLTPHIGTESLEARTLMAQEAAKNLEAFFDGKPLPNRVN